MSGESYTKLFSTIVTSTIWSEPASTCKVWVTMLAVVDRRGHVMSSVPGLARLANVSLHECEAALATFLAPDPYSRTKDNEGRRIAEIDGGWLLLNYAKYREKMAEADRREYKTQWQAKQREKDKEKAVHTSPQESTQSTNGLNGHNATADAVKDNKLSAEADECPHEQIIAAYHSALPDNPAIRVWTGKRAKMLRARWKEDPKRQNLDYWKRFFGYVAQSPFLTGGVSGQNGKPFRPGLDWMVNPENFAKIIEKRYHQ